MADEKLIDITAKATLDGTELVYVTDDPSGTPLDKKSTTQAVADLVSVPVKATGAEINTGTDDAKFATAKAIADSSLLKNGDTLTADIAFGENTALVYDSALSADGKYAGLVMDGTAGATLAFGDLCYFQAADSKWELTDADATATSGNLMVGICVLAGAEDAATKMLMIGQIRADAKFPTLTIGASAYIGTTAGEIQVAQPSGTDDVIRKVGFARTANELYFNPSNDYITHD